MRNLNRMSVVSAVFGCVVSHNSVSDAQQVTPPEPIRRSAPAVDDLKNTQVAKLGTTANKFSLTPQEMAIAKSISNSGAKIATEGRRNASAMAGSVSVVGVVKQPAATRSSMNAEDYCEKSTTIASQGTIANAVAVPSKRVTEMTTESKNAVKDGLTGIHSQSK